MKLALLVSALMLGGSLVATANEHESKNETSTDVSKNPVTGTKKTVKKTKKKMKGEHGKTDVEVKETIKEKTDGTVETKTEIDGTTSSETHK